MKKTAVTSAHTQRPASKKADPVSNPRQRRQEALADVRRELVLDAARSAFLELGIERASMREIARRAGYTPGAIYSYFPSKEALYGTLLGESLGRLKQRTHAALNKNASPADQARASATAFFMFYKDNPRDLDLGFYLFQGMQPRGLTPELNNALNQSLRLSLQPTQAALQQLGMPDRDALKEITALFAHAVGLLLLSHTGRIRMFHQDPRVLFDSYVDEMILRAGRAPARRNEADGKN